MTQTFPTITACLLVGLLALALSACNEDVEEKPKEDNLPPATVDLPPIPDDLGITKIPEKHPDGSLTVDGLRRNRPKYLDTKVRVKGKIVWIYECEWLKEKKKNPRRKKKRDPDEPPPTCQRPHLQITDANPESDEKMMVVKLGDYIQERIDEEDIKVDMEITVVGEFADIGDSFAAVEQGLIVMESIEGFEQPEDWKPKRR